MKNILHEIVDIIHRSLWKPELLKNNIRAVLHAGIDIFFGRGVGCDRAPAHIKQTNQNKNQKMA